MSKRLRAIAENIDVGAVIADIGTDHGTIPIYAVTQKHALRAIASDKNEGPLAFAWKNIKAEGLEHCIQLRTGEGLTVLNHQDQVDTIIISGMGGSLITSILDKGSAALSGVQKLILQPNVGAEVVRRWLLENNWKLSYEAIIEDSGRIYEILTAVPGEGNEPYSENPEKMEAQLLFGPFLLTNQNSAFTKKWQGEKKQWETILKELENAESQQNAAAKKNELMKKIKLAEEVVINETS